MEAGKPVYTRILLKLSGEALSGPESFGLHQPTIDRFAADLAAAYALNFEYGEEEEGTETPSGMRRILDRLREETDSVDGQILYLRFDLGLTHEAIAKIRGVSRVAITKRLTRIQARALELYAELEHQSVRAAA